ncbi:MAG: head GIN domain-containing protein [Anaerolineales bacterium]
MKKLLLPLILTILLSACNLTVVSGSGKIASSNRAVSAYSQLAFDAPGELTIVQNEKEALIIAGDDNLLGYIKTEVEAGVLHIYVTPGIALLDATQPIRYTLNVKSLSEVSLGGSGSITSAGLNGDQVALKLNGSGNITLASLKVDTLDFQMNGSGSLKLDALTARKVTLGMNGSGDAAIDALSADELRADVKGSGKYVLKGKVTRQNLSSLGSGKYDARALESGQADISVIGSGDSKVWATESLSISILGSGSVGYLGRPKLSQQVSGSGSIYTLE